MDDMRLNKDQSVLLMGSSGHVIKQRVKRETSSVAARSFREKTIRVSKLGLVFRY